MSREWMDFYENITRCMYINEYEDDMYCSYDYFGTDEESEKKADQIKEAYENVTVQNPYPKTISALPEKAAVIASKTLTPCLHPVLR